MYRIRYYDQVIHPDHFRGSALGWLIRALNSVRWWLETRVQLLVMRYLAKSGDLPRERLFEFRKVFDLDVEAERLEMKRTSPLVQGLEEPPAPPTTRSARYRRGSQVSALAEAHAVENGQEQPVRPRRLDNMIASYGAPGRERQYVHGRRYMADPEGDFEPLEDLK